MSRILLPIAIVATIAATVGYHVAAREYTYRRLVGQGDADLARGATFAALEAFSGAIALKPDSMLAHFRRGDAYQQLEDFEAALRDYETARRLDPAAPQPLEGIGDVSVRLGRPTQARTAYVDYLALDERSPRILHKLALLQYEQGQCAAAVQSGRQALALDERIAETHHLVGLCLLELDDRAGAIDALERATELQPGTPAPREALAEALAASGRHQDALHHLEVLAAFYPEQLLRHVALAREHRRAGQPERALQVLERATERFAGQAPLALAEGEAWLSLAVSREDPSALTHALELLAPLAQDSEATHDALAAYGTVLLLAGRAAEAEPFLQQAASRRPVDTATLELLATVGRRVGHPDVVRNALRYRDALTGPDGASR